MRQMLRKIGDKGPIELNAHSIKSAAANVGADILSRLSEELEQVSKGDNFEQMKLLIKEIEKEFSNFLKIIKEFSYGK